MKVKIKIKPKSKSNQSQTKVSGQGQGLNGSQNGSEMFEARHSNNKCQNDLNVKMNDECQNRSNMNGKFFDIPMMNIIS